MSDQKITTEVAAEENWKPQDGFQKLPCECVCGTRFFSHAKFSGKLVQIVSREPCPKCGNHALRGYSSGYEKQEITKKDVGQA
jgi:hypothetical protein